MYNPTCKTKDNAKRTFGGGTQKGPNSYKKTEKLKWNWNNL